MTPELRVALKVLMAENIGDSIYEVRERAALSHDGFEGNSWDHPRVKAFSDAISTIEQALKEAEVSDPSPPETKRYWVSWWSAAVPDTAPFGWWVTGYRATAPATSYVAVVDATTEDEVWQRIGQTFPDNERRFINEKVADWRPPEDRFP